MAGKIIEEDRCHIDTTECPMCGIWAQHLIDPGYVRRTQQLKVCVSKRNHQMRSKSSSAKNQE